MDKKRYEKTLKLLNKDFERWKRDVHQVIDEQSVCLYTPKRLVYVEGSHDLPCVQDGSVPVIENLLTFNAQNGVVLPRKEIVKLLEIAKKHCRDLRVVVKDKKFQLFPDSFELYSASYEIESDEEMTFRVDPKFIWEAFRDMTQPEVTLYKPDPRRLVLQEEGCTWIIVQK